MGAKELLQYYKDHVVTVDEAVKLVKDGDFIIDGHGHGRSPIFGPALLKRKDELKGVRLATGYNLEPSDHCAPEYDGIFNQVSIFNTGSTRQSQWEGRTPFVSSHFSQLDQYFRSQKPNIVWTMVTPPNEDGMVSTGVSVDFTRAAIDYCPTVIAQVNPNMPWVDGDAVVSVDKFTCFVEEATPLTEIPESQNPSEVDRAIAGHCAELINDGDTLQIGVGAVPDTVLSLLTNHKDLGIHTELGSTGIMRLMQKGVITNKKKTIDTGKVVCTLMGGTREFYDFVDHNDDFLMRRCTYVLNPANICQQKNMVALNACIEVDLLGQVNSEWIKGKEYSGVGGQVDFLRGAMMAEGGRSIICMPATAKGGTMSKIVAQFAAGTVVTASRYDVMNIVTEYGIAQLWGKSNEERAKALIEIAAPQFRAQLEEDYYNLIHNVAK